MELQTLEEKKKSNIWIRSRDLLVGIQHTLPNELFTSLKGDKIYRYIANSLPILP